MFLFPLRIADSKAMRSRSAFEKILENASAFKCNQEAYFYIHMWPWQALGAISYHFLGLKQENSSFVLRVHPRNNLFVFKWVGGNSFLSSSTQIPEQAPQEQERRPYIWLAAGVFYSPSCIYNPWCLGDMKFSRIILLVRYIQLGMYMRDASAYVSMHAKEYT